MKLFFNNISSHVFVSSRKNIVHVFISVFRSLFTFECIFFGVPLAITQFIFSEETALLACSSGGKKCACSEGLLTFEYSFLADDM